MWNLNSIVVLFDCFHISCEKCMNDWTCAFSNILMFIIVYNIANMKFSNEHQRDKFLGEETITLSHYMEIFFEFVGRLIARFLTNSN